jgi:hypothetical protein
MLDSIARRAAYTTSLKYVFPFGPEDNGLVTRRSNAEVIVLAPTGTIMSLSKSVICGSDAMLGGIRLSEPFTGE